MCHFNPWFPYLNRTAGVTLPRSETIISKTYNDTCHLTLHFILIIKQQVSLYPIVRYPYPNSKMAHVIFLKSYSIDETADKGLTK